MKTPHEWLGALSGNLDEKAIPLYLSESDIKAIQDEAFKQGWAVGHNIGYLEAAADARRTEPPCATT